MQMEDAAILQTAEKIYWIGSGTQSTYRGLGSIDIMAAVRSLIFIGKVRKDPTTRVLIHEKKLFCTTRGDNGI